MGKKTHLKHFCGFFVKRAIFVIAGLLMVTSVTPLVHGVSLDELERQQQEAIRQAEEYERQAEKKSDEAETIEVVVKKVNGEINSLQSRITSTERQITETGAIIAGTEQTIQSKEEALVENRRKQAQTLQLMYVIGRESALETLISSNSLSEVIARDQYMSALEQNIEQTIREVKQLKQELEAKRDDLKTHRQTLTEIKDRHLSDKKTVEYQKAEKNRLLNMTLAQQDQYLELKQKMEKEAGRLSQEIYRLRLEQAKRSKESFQQGGSSYPYAAINAVDPWLFLTRQCTSYAAWYWNGRLGKPFNNTRVGSGSAWNWPALASDQGYSVSSTPRVGAIISWQKGAAIGPYGHVAIVEAVNGNGTIDVSEYNWQPYVYTYRSNVNPDDYTAHTYIY